MSAAQLETAATALFGLAALLLLGLIVPFVRAYQSDRRRDLLNAGRRDAYVGTDSVGGGPASDQGA